MLTASNFVTFINAYAQRLQTLQSTLDELDNRIGDGDHGTNMARGFRTAAERLHAVPADDLGTLSNTAAMALLSSVGGASGPLYATVFMRFSTAWKGKAEADDVAISTGIASALDGLRARGKADVGDKTMIDVWTPVSEILQTNPTDVGFRLAVERAVEAAVETKHMLAKKGRAAYLGERSIGTCDPGSVSSAAFFEELADAAVGGVDKKEWQTSVL